MHTYYFTKADDESNNSFLNQCVSESLMMKKSKIQKNFKILLVDDDKDFNEALSFRLKDKDYDVIAVESGYEAVKAFEGNYFDLVLLDLKMTGMDGVETLQKITELKIASAVIIMTAYPEEKKMKTIRELNPFGVLIKPFDMEQLIPHIDEIKKEQKVEEGKNSCC